MKRLSSPKTAPSGNMLAAVGMFIAIVATLLDQEIVRFEGIVAGAVVGAVIGGITAYRVQMTAMPQMVAAFNGFGGGASALVAGAELIRLDLAGTPPDLVVSIPIVLGTVIGAVTLTGSGIAFAKLQELMSGAPTVYPGQQIVNGLLSLGLIALAVTLVLAPEDLRLFWGLLALAGLLGILLVIPIGGADMPVVISLLNSYSGLAACATGFVINNQGLVICGSLVGASGIILTQIMCRAMNRSLANVLFGAFGAAPTAGVSTSATGTVKAGTPDDAAMILDAARSVIIVPGYGLAVAQAQHAVRELGTLLLERGINVRYAIHPVAGRMPGHMNVLLAEADVPYELLVEMEEINSSFPRTDVALVIGANDVTNPDARDNPSSPIYGMPILEVDRATTVMVCKRSMNTGFAGVDNPLYTLPQTMMLFGDAKDTAEKVLRSAKDL
ncbi:MAG: NAD(P)(+) transhydrogenase (Re/Si-specific) subunit beta [Deltaproteobacteria bacterium]|nr:NAD(P)(+) transhydrogenase (Re/Si-specific) subunit beta [Deltaproteobacteria bacterium]MBW2413515.1 NAD(P)(+) transhydrogenase (Re/Si-specific) subunit beta [Deltaproteobacteria bacterium]